MPSNMWDGPNAVWNSIDNGRLKKTKRRTANSDTDIRKLLFKGKFSRIGDRIQDALTPSRR